MSKRKMGEQKDLIEVVVNAVSNFDIDTISSLLDENTTYNADKISKSEFVERLTEHFRIFTEKGDTMLLHTEGVCKMNCMLGSGVMFSGNNSEKTLWLIIAINKNRTVDIRECGYMIEPNEVEPVDDTEIFFKSKTKKYIPHSEAY